MLHEVSVFETDGRGINCEVTLRQITVRCQKIRDFDYENRNVIGSEIESNLHISDCVEKHAVGERCACSGAWFCRILKIASELRSSYLDDNCLCLFLQSRYPYSVFFVGFFAALSLRPCRSRCHLEPENLFDVCDVTG